MTEHALLAPERQHVGDRMSSGTILAYGYFTDDEQAVLVLNRPLPPYRNDDPLTERGDVALPANYRTFFMDAKGKRTDERHWWNLHDASNYMQEYMGQDR